MIKLNKNMIITYLSNGLAIFSGFFSMYLITHYLNVRIYGILAIIAATSGILTNLVSARTSEAIVKFVKEELLENNKENIKFILSIGFIIDSFIAIIIVTIFYFIADFIANNFIKNISYSKEVFIYSFITFFTYLKGVPYGFLQTFEKFLIINIIGIIENLSKIIFLLLLIFYFHNINLLNIIYVYIFVSLFSFIMFVIFFIFVYKQKFKKVDFQFNKHLLKKYWSFNLKTFTSSLLKAGNQKVDTLILGYFINTQVVGIYEIIKKIVATPLNFLVSPFNLLYYSKLVELYKKKDYKKFKNIINTITYKIVFISLLYLGLLYVLNIYIIELFNIKITIIEFDIYLILIFLWSIPYLWWVRLFSNIVNPMYSVYVNLYKTLFTLVIIIFTSFFKFYGLIFSLLLFKIFATIYWYLKYFKEIK